MCAQCNRERLAGLAALIKGTPEPRAPNKTKGASIVPKIRLGPRPEPTGVQRIERQVKLAELGKMVRGV